MLGWSPATFLPFWAREIQTAGQPPECNPGGEQHREVFRRSRKPVGQASAAGAEFPSSAAGRVVRRWQAVKIGSPEGKRKQGGPPAQPVASGPPTGGPPGGGGGSPLRCARPVGGCALPGGGSAAGPVGGPGVAAVPGG
ncbi:Hypothetical protein PFR_JS25-2_2 [Propionibacterium freudenreichii]|nr:Hypothetical protein PFR_JS25-2_2 [Propionibacterium freudenreichii]